MQQSFAVFILLMSRHIQYPCTCRVSHRQAQLMMVQHVPYITIRLRGCHVLCHSLWTDWQLEACVGGLMLPMHLLSSFPLSLSANEQPLWKLPLCQSADSLPWQNRTPHSTAYIAALDSWPKWTLQSLKHKKCWMYKTKQKKKKDYHKRL